MGDVDTWHKASASAGEVERQRWMAGRAHAAAVIESTAPGLTMAAIDGVPASSSEFGSAPEATVQAMARALRALHEVDAMDCPWVLDTPSRIAALRDRFATESLDTSQLSPAYRRYSAEQLLGFAADMAARCEDELVVTHGNLEPAHILLDGPDVVGMVSFAHLAVADRFRDIALLALHVAAAFPAELVPVLFTAYGLENPNPMAIDLAQLLLELEG